jgi:hypothetical protein
MVWLGPHRQVFEAHRSYFLENGYSEKESSALAQAIVAARLPEFALIRPARCFALRIPLRSGA